MYRWRLAALAGWGLAVVLYVGVCKLVRELLDAHASASLHTAPPGRVRAAQAVAEQHADMLDRLYRRSNAGEWGEALATAAAGLARDGFEDQAAGLFGLSGELLEAHDCGKVQSLRAL